MNVYAVKWVERGAGPQQYYPHENEYGGTDLRGIDFITCTNIQLAFEYVRKVRPRAEIERPTVLGPA